MAVELNKQTAMDLEQFSRHARFARACQRLLHLAHSCGPDYPLDCFKVYDRKGLGFVKERQFSAALEKLGIARYFTNDDITRFKDVHGCIPTTWEAMLDYEKFYTTILAHGTFSHPVAWSERNGLFSHSNDTSAATSASTSEHPSKGQDVVSMGASKHILSDSRLLGALLHGNELSGKDLRRMKRLVKRIQQHKTKTASSVYPQPARPSVISKSSNRSGESLRCDVM